MPLFIAAEILELADGETKELHIDQWDIGEMDITPRDGRPRRRIRVLRIQVPPPDKPIGPGYWDITGQTLIEQLLPYLRGAAFQRKTYAVTKHGVAPQARFSLKVSPL